MFWVFGFEKFNCCFCFRNYFRPIKFTWFLTRYPWQSLWIGLESYCIVFCSFIRVMVGKSILKNKPFLVLQWQFFFMLMTPVLWNSLYFLTSRSNYLISKCFTHIYSWTDFSRCFQSFPSCIRGEAEEISKGFSDISMFEVCLVLKHSETEYKPLNMESRN